MQLSGEGKSNGGGEPYHSWSLFTQSLVNAFKYLWSSAFMPSTMQALGCSMEHEKHGS